MKELMPFLQELAVKLGTTADQLWAVLLKQTNVEIMLCQLWMSIFFWGGIVITVLAIGWFILSAYKDEEIGMTYSLAIFITNLIVAITGYYWNYSDLLSLRQNPEYWALKEILSAIQ